MITRKREELSMPVVNLNGTSREELKQQCYDAVNALTIVGQQLNLMTPHGRDYQTIGFERYELARSQHLDRVRSIEAIKDEILAIYASLQT